MNTHRSSNDANLPAPLPLRVVPSHDEDLLSLLRSTAAGMGYPDYRWLLRPEGRGWDIKDTDLPLLSAKHDYQILEHLLLLSEEQVYSYTLHRFAAPLAQAHGQPLSAEAQHNPSSLLWLSSKLQEAYFLPLHTIRVCPICLQEQEAYDRLFWRLHLILYCPYHRVRLLEKCPSCEAPIASNRQVASSCPRCQQAYGMVDPTPLSSTNPFSIGERLLLKDLGFALQEDVLANRALTTSLLSRLLDSSYLSFLHTLTSGLNARFSLQELALLIKILGASSDEDLTQHQDLLQQQKVASFLLFHWLFLEWPSHFFTFLEVWYSLSTPPFMGQEPVPVLSSSHSLFHEPNKPDIEGWLQEAYQAFHRQFRPDPRRADHLRETMNRLAQADDLPRKADEPWRRASSKQGLRVYIPPRSLTPTPPLPWESLGSVLSCAARKMNHPYPGLLLYDPPFSPGSSLFSPQSEVRLPPEAGDTMLAYLLQIPREHIAHLTGSSLITALGLPPYNLSRFWVQLTDPDLRFWLHPFMTATTRVCPYCIREQPGYDRLYWSMQGVQSCPRHNVRLPERCPACLKPIPDHL
jgi:hypothetical protein